MCLACIHNSFKVPNNKIETGYKLYRKINSTYRNIYVNTNKKHKLGDEVVNYRKRRLRTAYQIPNEINTYRAGFHYYTSLNAAKRKLASY